MSESLLLLRLKTASEECTLHCKRICDAMQKIQYLFPLSIDSYKNLSDDDIMALDQFIYRYTKLQDTIGSSFIKNICIFLEGDNLQRSFIDNLHILEKHHIIENAFLWDELREMRNTLTHEYFNDTEQQVAMLNKLMQYKDVLIAIFDKIHNIVKSSN